MQAEAFDTYASAYDVHFTNGLVGVAQRNQVYFHVLSLLNKSIKTILEINCGTGKDAVWFAEKELNVLATDASEGMLTIAKEKINNHFLKFKKIKTQEISSLHSSKFDLIFSNFGGLNCLNKNEFAQLKNDCSLLQHKSNRLIFVIMGTNCLWERFYFWYKKDFFSSSRRKIKLGVDTKIDGIFFKTYYYSPNEIINLFKENYTLVSLKPIGFFVPPTYLEGYFKNKKSVFKLFIFLDKIIRNISFLANYADHYLICLEKK